MDGREEGTFLVYLLLTHSHALVRDIYSFPRVVRETIEYITKYDNPSPPDLKDKRKVFVGGGSLGGLGSLEYCFKPTQKNPGQNFSGPPPSPPFASSLKTSENRGFIAHDILPRGNLPQ